MSVKQALNWAGLRLLPGVVQLEVTFNYVKNMYLHRDSNHSFKKLNEEHTTFI